MPKCICAGSPIPCFDAASGVAGPRLAAPPGEGCPFLGMLVADTESGGLLQKRNQRLKLSPRYRCPWLVTVVRCARWAAATIQLQRRACILGPDLYYVNLQRVQCK